jgi:hypothetical protein
LTTPGFEHTPGKITSYHQQVYLAIQRGQRPPRRVAPHRVSPPSRRATPTRAARNCSSLSPGASPARATTSANADRSPTSRAATDNSSMNSRLVSLTAHLGNRGVGAQGAVHPRVIMPTTLGVQRVEVDPQRRTGSPVPDTPFRGVSGTVCDTGRG